MYLNVKAEMTRQGLILQDLAKYMGWTVATTSNKLNGKAPLTVKEAKDIKKFLSVDIPLEILFQEAV